MTLNTHPSWPPPPSAGALTSSTAVKSIGPEALEPMVVRNNNCDVHVKLFVGRFPINLDDCAIVKLFENYCEVIDFIRLQPKVKDMQTGCGLLKVI